METRFSARRSCSVVDHSPDVRPGVEKPPPDLGVWHETKVFSLSGGFVGSRRRSQPSERAMSRDFSAKVETHAALSGRGRARDGILPALLGVSFSGELSACNTSCEACHVSRGRKWGIH